MTICETLAIARNENRAVIAERCLDKYSGRPCYEISVCGPDGLAIVTVKAAKTTWKKRFAEMVREWRIEK